MFNSVNIATVQLNQNKNFPTLFIYANNEEYGIISNVYKWTYFGYNFRASYKEYVFISKPCKLNYVCYNFHANYQDNVIVSNKCKWDKNCYNFYLHNYNCYSLHVIVCVIASYNNLRKNTYLPLAVAVVEKCSMRMKFTKGERWHPHHLGSPPPAAVIADS